LPAATRTYPVTTTRSRRFTSAPPGGCVGAQHSVGRRLDRSTTGSYSATPVRNRGSRTSSRPHAAAGHRHVHPPGHRTY
jgi:hypothetical protein